MELSEENQNKAWNIREKQRIDMNILFINGTINFFAFLFIFYRFLFNWCMWTQSFRCNFQNFFANWMCVITAEWHVQFKMYNNNKQQTVIVDFSKGLRLLLVSIRIDFFFFSVFCSHVKQLHKSRHKCVYLNGFCESVSVGVSLWNLWW